LAQSRQFAQRKNLPTWRKLAQTRRPGRHIRVQNSVIL
jgi:hypothetical protein